MRRTGQARVLKSPFSSRNAYPFVVSLPEGVFILWTDGKRVREGETVTVAYSPEDQFADLKADS